MSEFSPLGDSAITMIVGEGISVELSDLVAARAPKCMNEFVFVRYHACAEARA